MNLPWRLPLAALAVAVLVSLSGLLVACGGSGSPETSNKVTLQLNWFHEAEFVGYYVAQAKGFYAADRLSVNILEGGPGHPAIDRVVKRTADFAISSFGEQKDSVARKQPVVAVLAAFQISPLVIFSLAESGIKQPSDLVGRRVGVTTGYWKGILNQTLMAAGVDPAKVIEVRVKAEDLEALYSHQVDAWLGYAQDEPIQAQMTGHKVTDIFPSDYGVGGYEGLLLVNESTIKDAPDLVRRFVGASQQGWRYAVEHPDEAAQILLKWAPKPGLQFQKLAVRAVGPLVDTPQASVGWIDAARWERLMGAAYDPARPGYTMRFSASQP
jgi:ABC-type nitrate/sulfonate/bicarbonate transport system substrate-binding protein